MGSKTENERLLRLMESQDFKRDLLFKKETKTERGKIKAESPVPVGKPVDRKAAVGAAMAPRAPNKYLQDLKFRIHAGVVSKLDMTRVKDVQRDDLREEITPIIESLIEREGVPLNADEREWIVREVLNQIFGLGPLEPLLDDPMVSDILVNGCNHVYIERYGKLERTEVTFNDDEHLLQIIDRIVSRVGRRIDEASPMVDARLPDGSRVNAIIPPLSVDGPVLSIRRFGTIKVSMAELIRTKTVTEKMAFVLIGCVRARLNILIAGGTGAGKTTLLNVLSSYIPEDERIITIEDSAELQMQQEHVVRLETRPSNIEGKGEVAQRDLVRNALRMRPDRIVVGEVRGAETIDMLQAMNTGHDGSLTTVHANSPRDAMARLETMISMAGLNLSDKAMRMQVASAINLIVHVARLSDGTRKVVSVSEITGMEGDIVTMQEIFKFERLGVDHEGKVLGEIVPTGLRPKFAERLERYGYPLGRVLFEGGPSPEVESSAQKLGASVKG